MSYDWSPKPEVVSRVGGEIRDILDSLGTARLLHEYYNPDRPFAGVTFDLLGEGGDAKRDVVSETDLLAVSLLDTPYPAKAVRLLIQQEPTRREISQLLHEVPPRTPLWRAEDEALDAANAVWDYVKHLGGGRIGLGQTRISKLLARKRPHLIPISDSIVSRVIERALKGSHWGVLRECLRHPDPLRARLDELKAEAQVDDRISLLRILDVSLWMHRSSSDNAEAVRLELGI